MTATNPEGGAAIPVSIDTTRTVMGGAAIPVYGYSSVPTDGRPAMGGAAIPVRVLAAADLKENGGMWTLEGRPFAMPVYTAPATTTVQGGPALAVYPINAWPPSNAAPAFTPLNIAGLALWLKADGVLWQDAARTVPAVADADPVGAWDDASGNGRNAVQATAAKRPILKLNVQNGKPGVRCDGVDDFLAATVNQAFSNVSLFVVSKCALNGKAMLDFRDATGIPIITLLDWAGTVFSRLRNDAGVLSGASPVPADNDTGYVLRELIWDGTNHTYFKNTTQLWQGAFGAGTITLAGAYSVLGAAYDGSTPAATDLCEIILYSTGVAGANLTNLRAWLNTKYAMY